MGEWDGRSFLCNGSGVGKRREELQKEPEGGTRDCFFQRPRLFPKDKCVSEQGSALVQYTQVTTLISPMLPHTVTATVQRTQEIGGRVP